MSAGNDKHLNIWKTDGELVDLIERNEQENLNCVLILPNSRETRDVRVVTAGNGAEMVVYSLTEKRCVSLLVAHREPVRCLISLSPTLFASASIDGQIVIWSATTLTKLFDLNFHKTYINADHVYIYNVHQLVKLSEQYLAACIGNGYAVYKVTEKSAETVMECLNAHSATVLSIAPLYYGTALVTSSADTTIRIWSSKNEFQFRTPPAQRANPSSKDQPGSSSKGTPSSTPSKSKGGSRDTTSGSSKDSKDPKFGHMNNLNTDPRADAKYVPAEKVVERGSMGPIFTLLDSDRPATGTYPPRLIGDVCCHSDQVNVILPLTPFSYASASSDGGIVIWRDGRVQSSFRTDLAIQSLKQWHMKQFEMSILEATTSQYASAEAKYALNGSESSIGERTGSALSGGNVLPNSATISSATGHLHSSTVIPSHLMTGGSSGSGTGSNSGTSSGLHRETRSDFARSPSSELVPSAHFDSQLNTPNSPMHGQHPLASSGHLQSSSAPHPLLSPTPSYDSMSHLSITHVGALGGGVGSGLNSPRSPDSSRPPSGKLQFATSPHQLHQPLGASGANHGHHGHQGHGAPAPRAHVRVPPYIADNAYYLYYELNYSLEQVQEALLADGNSGPIVIAAIAELQQ